MKTRDERMEEWMHAEFQKTSSALEHYPVFAELFRTVFNSILNGEKIDALDCPDQLLQEDEPEFGTVRENIEQRSPELFRHYLKCLGDGHSAEFACIFALKVDEHCDDLQRASHDTFDAIRTGWECNMANRAYAEAHAVCLHQGRSPLFAEKCADYLFDCDLCFSRAQAKAGTYEKTFEACIAKGYPPIRAKAFAEYFTQNDGFGFSEAFARAYEEQVAQGKSHNEAWNYADTFLEYYSRFCSHDWDESESDGDNDRARIHAEGDLRARGKGFDRNDYAETFASYYDNDPVRSGQPLAERLAEVEARTDVAMKERVLRRAHRNDKGCAHGTVYLDLETRRTAAEAGGWDKLEELGVSIAVAVASDGPHVFTEATIPRLARLLGHAERIVGFNLHNFDLKVLKGYAGFSVGQARTVDLLDEVELAAGHRVSLQGLASATLGITLSRDSLDMVKSWKDGRILEVIEGCSNDVFAIQALDEYVRAHGELFYVASEGQQRERIAIDPNALK